MIAALLVASLAADLALVFVAVGPGFSRVAGPFRIRLHDPTALLVVAAILSGALVARSWRPGARGWSLALAAAAAGVAAIALTRAAAPIFPLGDIAVIELYVRDALGGRLLAGPYSRFGWHHPGPIAFYALAPFYAAGARTTASLAAGSVAIAMAAIGALAWALARSMRPAAAAAILLAAIAYLWRVPGLAASVWNPHLIVLPAMALIAASAGAAGGDAMLLPLVTVLASFVVQTDVALVPVAAVTALAAAAGAAAVCWRDDRAAVLVALNASAWIAAALWLLPLAEQFTHQPGNATELWQFFTAPRGGQSVEAALGAWGAMLIAPLLPGFALATGGTFETAHPFLLASFAIAQVALVAAVVAARRRSEPGLSRLAAFSAGASVVALWSATRIVDRVMDHEVFWISALGALNAGVLIAEAATRIARTRLVATRIPAAPPAVAARLGRRPTAIVNGAAIAAAAAICFGQAERAREGRLPVTPASPVVERLTGSVRQYLESKGAHKPLVRIGESTWSLAAGVLLEADRGGIPFAVEESWMPMFPHSFAADGDEDAEIAFGSADEHAVRAAVPGAEAIASFSNTYIDGLPYRAP